MPFLDLVRRKKIEEGLRKTRETWFRRVTALLQDPAVDEDLWEQLQELLIAADVGVETTGHLLRRLWNRSQREKLRGEALGRALQEEMVALFPTDGPPTALPEGAPRPYVILVVGVNGTGKTTTIAKLAHLYGSEGRRVLLAAADTFRAAAIEQLQIWGERAGAEVIAHRPGADPGAVAFDACQAARARGLDLVLVDTAGRLHTKSNLMEELRKIRRVLARFDETAPHEVLLIIDATTGQNGLVQARVFKEAAGVTGLILTKVDGTAKGGIVLGVSHQLNLPVHYLGTGEGLEDLVPFVPEAFVEALTA